MRVFNDLFTEENKILFKLKLSSFLIALISIIFEAYEIYKYRAGEGILHYLHIIFISVVILITAYVLRTSENSHKPNFRDFMK